MSVMVLFSGDEVRVQSCAFYLNVGFLDATSAMFAVTHFVGVAERADTVCLDVGFVGAASAMCAVTHLVGVAEREDAVDLVSVLFLVHTSAVFAMYTHLPCLP